MISCKSYSTNDAELEPIKASLAQYPFFGGLNVATAAPAIEHADDIPVGDKAENVAAIHRAIASNATQFEVCGKTYYLDPVTNRIFTEVEGKLYEDFAFDEDDSLSLLKFPENLLPLLSSTEAGAKEVVAKQLDQIRSSLGFIEEESRINELEEEERLIRSFSGVILEDYCDMICNLFSRTVGDAQDRLAKINELGVSRIVDGIKDRFETLAAFKTRPGDKSVIKAMAALNLFGIEINSDQDIEDWYEAIQDEIPDIVREASKIVDNWNAILRKSAKKIQDAESISFDVFNRNAKKKSTDVTDSETDPNDTENGTEDNDKESWAVGHDAHSVESKMSARIKAFLYSITETENDEMLTPKMNNMGFPKPVGGKSYGIVTDILSGCTDAEQMMKDIHAAALKFPWLYDLEAKLQASKDKMGTDEYDGLFSEFWFNCSLIQTSMVNHEVETVNGVQETNVKQLNRKDGEAAFANLYLGSIESYFQGIADNQYPLADDDGNIDQKEAEAMRQFFSHPEAIVAALEGKKFKGKEAADVRHELFERLRSMGVLFESDEEAVMEQFIKNKGDLKMRAAFGALANVAKNLKNQKNIETLLLDKRAHKMLSTTVLAEGLSFLTPAVTESSVTIGNKTKYAKSTANFLGRLSIMLERRSPAEAYQYLMNEYGSYPQYRNQETGKWNYTWLQEIADQLKAGKNPDLRMNTAIVERNGMGYTEMGKLDTARLLLEEYFSEDNEYAMYVTPVQSDAPSCNAIRGRRYHLTADGKMNQDLLIGFAQMFLNEYDRIKLATRRKAGEDARAELLSLLKEKNEKKLANIDARIVSDFLQYHPEIEALIKQGNYNDAAAKTADLKLLPIKNWDIDKKSRNAGEFCLFPGLNNKSGEIFTTLAQLEEGIANGTKTKADFYSYIMEVMEEHLEGNFQQALKEWESFGLFEISYDKELTASGKKKQNEARKEGKKADLIEGVDYVLKESKKNLLGINGFTQADANDPSFRKLREFYFNSVFANCNITAMTTADIAFYKKAGVNKIVDFQKRFKEIHAPASRLDESVFKLAAGEHGYVYDERGRLCRQEIYVKDIEVPSQSAEEIFEAFMSSIDNNPNIKDKEAARASFKKLAEDAYGLADENGRRKAAINMADAQAWCSADWYLDALKAMGSPHYKQAKDAMEHISKGEWTMQDLKVVCQTFKPYRFGLTDYTDPITGTKMAIPSQGKNSESCMPGLIAAFLNMNEGANKTESNFGKMLTAMNNIMNKHHIHCFQMESAIKAGLHGAIKIDPFADPATIEREITNQIFNTDGSINRQVVKLIPISSYGIQTSEHEHLKDRKQKIGLQINKLILADLVGTNYEAIHSGVTFEKPADLIKFHGELMKANIFEDADKLNKMFNNNKALATQLARSIAESDRYSDEVKKAIRLNDNGEFDVSFDDPLVGPDLQSAMLSLIQKRVIDQETPGGTCTQLTCAGTREDLKIVFDTDAQGRKHIKYLECLAPMYSQQMVERCTNPDGTIDMSKIDPELLDLIGYRTPTEDKYSMCPIKIVGFLPNMEGSSIILPAEITTLSGSDFDIDHLYVMVPEFNYNEETDHFEYVKYDASKSAEENSRKARNNALMDTYWAVLTNNATITSQLRPGGFDEEKRVGARMSIMKLGKARIIEICEANDIKFKDAEKYSDFLDQFDEDAANTILAFANTSNDPMSPLTFSVNHNNNFMGKRMLAMYAVHVSSHAVGQLYNNQTGIAFDGNLTITTSNGTTIRPSRLDAILAADGRTISENLAGLLAGAADNVKDPTLVKMNQNELTIGISCMLVRMGVSIEDVATLMSTPIMRWMAESFAKAGNKGSIDSFLKKIVGEESLMADGTIDIPGLINAKKKVGKFSIEMMAHTYDSTPMFSELTVEEKQLLSFIKYCDNIVNGGFEYVTTCLKPEKSLKQTFIDSYISTQFSEDEAGVNAANEYFHFNSPGRIEPGMSTEEIDRNISNFDAAIPAAAIRRSVSTLLESMSKRFKIGSNSAVIEMYRMLQEIGLNAHERENFVNSYANYLAQRAKAFLTIPQMKINNIDFGYKGAEKFDDLNSADAYEAVKAYYLGLNAGPMLGNYKSCSFVKLFEKVKSNKELMKTYPVLKYLKINKSRKHSKVPVIELKLTGSKSKELKSAFQFQLTSMLHDGNPAHEIFVRQLAMYCNFRDSFSRYGGAFGDIIPTAAKAEIEGYAQAIKEGTQKISKDEVFTFANQYLAGQYESIERFSGEVYDSTTLTLDHKYIVKGNKPAAAFIVDMKGPKSYKFKLGSNGLKQWVRINAKVQNPMDPMSKINVQYLYCLTGIDPHGNPIYSLVPKAGADGVFDVNPYDPHYVSSIGLSSVHSETRAAIAEVFKSRGYDMRRNEFLLATQVAKAEEDDNLIDLPKSKAKPEATINFAEVDAMSEEEFDKAIREMSPTNRDAYIAHLLDVEQQKALSAMKEENYCK